MDKILFILFISISSLLFTQDWGWDLTEKKEFTTSKRGETIFKSLITYYQKEVSPIQGDRCPFYPSCSHFTLKSMELFGFNLGLIMGIERIYYRENYGLFHEPTYYEKIYLNGRRRLYDIPWANNIFKESSWYFYSPYFYITPSSRE